MIRYTHEGWIMGLTCWGSVIYQQFTGVLIHFILKKALSAQWHLCVALLNCLMVVIYRLIVLSIQAGQITQLNSGSYFLPLFSSIILKNAVAIVASGQDVFKIQAFGGFFRESSSHHYGERKKPRKACRFNAD